MPSSLHVVCTSCHAVNRLPEDRLGEAGACGKCHSLLFKGQPIELDETGFDKQMTRSDIPLIVDFWAPWCGPCRTMAPAFAEAARRLEPRYLLIKVNTEEVQALANRFGIRSIPTLAIFRGGREVARQSGALDTGSILRWVESNS